MTAAGGAVNRRAAARINLAATQRNAARILAGLRGGARLCAVVKARASGHGAVPVARAALAGGATSLAVATADEAAELRAAGLRDVPVLVLGALSSAELVTAVGAGAEVVAWDPRFVDALGHAVRAHDGAAPAPIRVHVKYDTGLGRLGTRDLEQALALARSVHATDGLRLHGAMTHLATADGDPEFMAAQLEAFAPFVTRMRTLAPIIAHAANSAATLREPASHLDMVRCGIALHGGDPMNEDPDAFGLEPALELSSYLAAVKLARPGESIGYGRRFVASRETWVATLPIGYADGIRRAHTNNGAVLVAGRRHAIVGTVSMDNTTIELGPGEEPPARVGEPAVLIGRSGDERLTAEDLAQATGTINHEVLCAISDRVVREWHRDGEPVDV